MKNKIEAKFDIVHNTHLSRVINPSVNKNNTTGVRGVYYHRHMRAYCAEIRFQRKRYHLGYYEHLNDAATARKTAENRLHGEFLDWYYETYPEQRKNHMRQLRKA